MAYWKKVARLGETLQVEQVDYHTEWQTAPLVRLYYEPQAKDGTAFVALITTYFVDKISPERAFEFSRILAAAAADGWALEQGTYQGTYDWKE